MARRPGARRVDPRVTRLPGFEDPEPPAEERVDPVAPPRADPMTEATDATGPAEPTPAPRRRERPPGPTLEERQSRWMKERDRFESRRST